MNSPLKPLGSDLTIKQNNTSAIKMEKNGKKWMRIKQQENQTH